MAIDVGNISILVVFDNSTAFGILRLLCHSEILVWYYRLTDRVQLVRHEAHLSSNGQVLGRIHQGLVLGLNLVLLYLVDLPAVIEPVVPYQSPATCAVHRRSCR